MSLIRRLLVVFERACAQAGVALTALIVLLLAAQIFFRYILNQSLVWSEEVATWCMVWVVFIGSATLMYRWQHVQIPMFVRLLPRRVRPPAIIFAKLATSACAGLIAYHGWRVFQGSFHIVSQTTGISSGWIKLAVPIGMALMAIFAAASLAEDVRRLARGELDAFDRYGRIDLDELAGPAADAADPDAARRG